MKGLLATSRGMSIKSNKTIEPFKSCLRVPHDLKGYLEETLLANLERKGAFLLSAFPFPTVQKKCGLAHSSLAPAIGKETTLERHMQDAHTLHARHSYFGSFRHSELVFMDTLSVQSHSKWIEETKRTSWNLRWLCFGLCSLFTSPYTMQLLSSLLLTLVIPRYHVMLLWGRNNGNKASENICQYF